jgi:hypothetical protein
VRDFLATDFQLWIKEPPPASVWTSPITGPLTLVRIIDKNLYIDGPRGFAVSEEGFGLFRPLTAPGTEKLTEMVAFSGGFAVANGGGSIFFAEVIGAWNQLGVLPADKYEALAASGEQLWTIGKSARTLEIWSSNGKIWRNAGIVPGSLGNINQILWNSNHLMLATSTGIYEGDTAGKEWKRTDSPKSEILTLAIRDGRFLAGTSSGLWGKTAGSNWLRMKSPG